jgi:hypothetical protein
MNPMPGKRIDESRRVTDEQNSIGYSSTPQAGRWQLPTL